MEQNITLIERETTLIGPQTILIERKLVPIEWNINLIDRKAILIKYETAPIKRRILLSYSIIQLHLNVR